MPREVSKDIIDYRPVREWQRLIIESARERRDDISLVDPFRPLQVLYPEVMRELRDRTTKGLEWYHRIVRSTTGYELSERLIVIPRDEWSGRHDEILFNHNTLKEIISLDIETKLREHIGRFARYEQTFRFRERSYTGVLQIREGYYGIVKEHGGGIDLTELLTRPIDLVTGERVKQTKIEINRDDKLLLEPINY